ncbi:aspyridone synthetase trans-acting enoyl reductase [Microdochium nivale]|nr:aspyridone synthetase trans-acting enoyl reductase [Microdochium nivale]
MRAIVNVPHKTVVLRSDVPVPKPGLGEILVKVHYAAQNPTDFKSPISGDRMSSSAVGQRVAGWVQGATAGPDRGAFAEYLTTEASLVFPVPDSVGLDVASTVSVGVSTAVQALFQRLGLPETSVESVSSGGSGGEDKRTPVLIYGGTSSVVLYAVQLARLASLRVIATGSARNRDLLRSLGADETVDYNDADWADQVRKLTGDNLRHALDNISTGETIKKVATVMSSTQGGHVVSLVMAKHVKLPEDLRKRVKVELIVAYTVFERPLPESLHDPDNHGGRTTGDRRFWEEHGLQKLPGWLELGGVKPNAIKLLGGLDAVEEGLKMHAEGNVSVEKIVYKVM